MRKLVNSVVSVVNNFSQCDISLDNNKLLPSLYYINNARSYSIGYICRTWKRDFFEAYMYNFLCKIYTQFIANLCNIFTRRDIRVVHWILGSGLCNTGCWKTQRQSRLFRARVELLFKRRDVDVDCSMQRKSKHCTSLIAQSSGYVSGACCRAESRQVASNI